MNEVTTSDPTLVENPQPFAEYLAAHGAEILEPTNAYEVLRYRMEDCGVVVIHKNAKGMLTSMPAAAWHHYSDFRKNRAPVRFGRPKAATLDAMKERLLARDGDRCCYCSAPLEDDVTLEHWLSVRDGGNNSMANTALAHEACNQAAGSLPITHKLKIRDTLTAATRGIGGRLDNSAISAIVATITEGLAEC